MKPDGGSGRMVSPEEVSAAILGRLKAIPAVEKVHSTSGRVDLLLQLGCASTAELDEVLDRIGNLTGVRASESLVHLSTKFDRAV